MLYVRRNPIGLMYAAPVSSSVYWHVNEARAGPGHGQGDILPPVRAVEANSCPDQWLTDQYVDSRRQWAAGYVHIESKASSRSADLTAYL